MPTTYCAPNRGLASTQTGLTRRQRTPTSTCSCCCTERVQSLVVCSLIFAGYLSNAFITRGEEDDEHEGEEERDGAGDAPLAEDDAEVFR